MTDASTFTLPEPDGGTSLVTLRSRAGGRGARHTHCWGKQLVVHTNILYCLDITSITLMGLMYPWAKGSLSQ